MPSVSDPFATALGPGRGENGGVDFAATHPDKFARAAAQRLIDNVGLNPIGVWRILRSNAANVDAPLLSALLDALAERMVLGADAMGVNACQMLLRDAGCEDASCIIGVPQDCAPAIRKALRASTTHLDVSKSELRRVANEACRNEVYRRIAEDITAGGQERLAKLMPRDYVLECNREKAFKLVSSGKIRTIHWQLALQTGHRHPGDSLMERAASFAHLSLPDKLDAGTGLIVDDTVTEFLTARDYTEWGGGHWCLYGDPNDHVYPTDEALEKEGVQLTPEQLDYLKHYSPREHREREEARARDKELAGSTA